jgi:hypothetical protein
LPKILGLRLRADGTAFLNFAEKLVVIDHFVFITDKLPDELPENSHGTASNYN